MEKTQSIHDQMTFDFTQLKKIALTAGLQHLELARLLKITRPTFYLWCRGGKPQTIASYESALKVLKAINRGLRHLRCPRCPSQWSVTSWPPPEGTKCPTCGATGATRDFPIPDHFKGEERAKEIAERYARNYVAE